MRGFLRRTRIGTAVLVVTGALAGQAGAQDLVVKSARVTVATSDPTDARVVGTITNPGMYSTYLVTATSDAAERIELRDARKGDARVQEVEIAAYGTLVLEAKGLYLKLMNLKRPLRPGNRVEVVLANEVQGKTLMNAVVTRP
jgi:copper(I)-binding protein